MSKGAFSAYREALAAIASRTGAPLPSLIISFGIVHETTALVPLVGGFYAARALGIGERVIDTLTDESTPDGDANVYVVYAKTTMKRWVEEGDKWAARVGRRYGMFGYEKRQPGAVDDSMAVPQGDRISGDIANAVLAYGITKALLPVRIGLSLYLTPGFSRGVIEPTRKAALRLFRRTSQ